MSDQLHNNTLKLTRFIFRKELLYSFIWLFITIVITLLVAVAFQNMYTSAVERQVMAETMKNPAMVALVGPVLGADNYTLGAMMTNMMMLFTILAIAIMNIFLVVRYTRKDEENGRIELIQSLPVGRLSNLSATMIVCILINLSLAILISIGLFVLQIESMNLIGSIVYGATLGVSGIFFGAITALFVQIASTSRGATGFSFILFGITFLIRAIGDVSNKAISLLSPIGIILKTEAYVNNYWWPIITVLLLSIIIGIIAFYLNLKRDFGSGMIAVKPGRKNASKFLNSSFMFSLRLLRSTLIGWGITMFVLGISYGSVFGDLEKFFKGNELLKQMFANRPDLSFAEQFLPMLMVILSIAATIPTLIAMLKIRSEEKKERLEHIVSKSVSHNKVLSGYLIISIITAFIMMFLSILGLWIAASATMSNPITLIILLKAGLSYFPSMLVMIGITTLLIAYLPKFSGYIWGYLGLSFFIVYIGQVLQLPSWTSKISPYGYISRFPVEKFNLSILIILIIVAIGMFILSFLGYKKRDIRKV